MASLKIASLIIRALTKPLANRFKVRAKESAKWQSVCRVLGNVQHRILVTMSLSSRKDGIKEYRIKPLSHDIAIENGADLLGELVIVTVAITLTGYELRRSSLKSTEKAVTEQKIQEEKERQLLQRFQCVEKEIQELKRIIDGIHKNDLVEKSSYWWR